MISLSIERLDRISKQDADALRAIADIYHPAKRNDDMPVSTLRAAVQAGNSGALDTLGELNGAAQVLKVDSLSALGTACTLTTTGVIESGNGAWAVNAGENIIVRPSEGKVTIGSAHDALGAAFLASAQSTAARTGAIAKVHELHPHDNPAVGAPTADDIADKVFSGGGVTIGPNGIEGIPGVVMNQHEQSITISANSPMGRQLAAFKASVEVYPAQVFSGATAADVAAGFTDDPAKVFSGGGLAQGGIIHAQPVGLVGETASEQPAPNVQSVTPIPPPLPIVTAQTLPPQSVAATNDSLPPPPPPAPVPSDASAGAGTTSHAPSSVELDTTGLPWDGRIHAGTKSKVASGAWMKRRGVEASEVSRIEAQLRAAMAIPAPPPPPANLAVQQHQQLTALASTTTGELAPTFPTLMTFITERVMTNRLTQEQVQAAVQTVGLESINLVMAREDLIPAIMAELRKVAP